MASVRLLLLTNRDSDNVGDQIIEATAISVLKTVMNNIGVGAEDVTVSSRAASIISRKYMRTGDPKLLASARKAISSADAVVFGGAPLFNYAYQVFYLRTIKTLELAEEYDTPVLFSSIGVEPFDAANPKCLELKAALSLPCVRQITTRDDFESVQKYAEGTDVPIAHVADPAVFADIVFRQQASPADGRTKKRVGLVVTRAGIFKDNGIDFPESEQRNFWLDVIALLTERGYDYRLLTTGHFTDEVFLDGLVRSAAIPANQAAATVNSPEELVREISECDGVIAYRLHASITAFAYNVPSVGLSWNFKVPYFYDSVGYGDRALDHSRWTAPEAVNALEKAMAEGVTKDEAFLMTVYDTLFDGLKRIFAPDIDRTAYTYEELQQKLVPYAGTSLRTYQQKVQRKLRRIYEYYPAEVKKEGTSTPSGAALIERKANSSTATTAAVSPSLIRQGLTRIRRMLARRSVERRS